MSLPGNGIFVVKGELAVLMTAMKRGARWSSHSHQDDDLDALMRDLQDLKELLNRSQDLKLIEPTIYLAPFLEVIRSEKTTGPVTSLALSAVNKFLSYGLIDPTGCSVPLTVHNIADAANHARFVGTDQASDGVVLMKILQLLHTLALSPEGALLTNERLCEIMLSCFHICSETRLNELLRKTAEHYLKDMVQLVFMRLPQFSDDNRLNYIKHLKMRRGSMEQVKNKKGRSSFKSKEKQTEVNELNSPPKSLQTAKNESLSAADGNIVDMQGSITQDSSQMNLSDLSETNSSTVIEKANGNEQNVSIEEDNRESSEEKEISLSNDSQQPNQQQPQSEQQPPPANPPSPAPSPPQPSSDLKPPLDSHNTKHEYVNQLGIRFTPQLEDEIPLIPYGIPSVRELFRFLISLCNPVDKQNTEVMIHLGLTLLTVAFEVGADSICKYSSLLALVKDGLCRNLFALLSSDRLSLFAADLQLSFLMFESARTHLKFQLERYLTKLIEIITTDSQKQSYEFKELALDNILQLWRIPGFVAELYLNYDCDMYCADLYENLTQLLAKNPYPATVGVFPTHLVSLDALLAVVEDIKTHCVVKLEGRSVRNGSDGRVLAEEEKEGVEKIDKFLENGRMKMSEQVPPREKLLEVKNLKKWLPTGTEHFNNKPKKGIQFLQEHGILSADADPQEIVTFLRENPNLDKKMIGEYISGRNNSQILEAFVKMFDFTGLRVDEALRLYLETFRLPGEAPLISLLLEHFAEHWHKCNGEPFANADAAFTLAYAVIMLNVDQHNHIVKKQNIPMSPEGFKKNLKKVNGGEDFDQDMLDEIYNAIKNEEIVMPAEQTGIVRENYLWKVLLRRGASKDGRYLHVTTDIYDYDLFRLIFEPTSKFLSFIFDKSEDPNVYKRALDGFEMCAFISSHFGINEHLDCLLQTLCKFTRFDGRPNQNYGAVQFGSNVKAQIALKMVFSVVHQFGDNVRESWKQVFDLILSLFINELLPKCYLEVEDFIEPSGKIKLAYEEVQTVPKQDTSLFSSLYSYMVSSENLSKIPTPEEKEAMERAKRCVRECNLEQFLTDSKFLHDDSLQEMIKVLVDLSKGPDVQKALGYGYNESVTTFFLELLISIVVQNRDRVMTIWPTVRDHIYTLVMNSSYCDYQYLLERSVIGLLRLAIRLMRNEEMSPVVLQSLRMLLLLKSSMLFKISRQISFGLYELLKTSAQNIHTSADWSIVFTLLECVGAGAQPPKPVVEESQLEKGAKSEGESPVNSEEEVSKTERGYTSDSELMKSPRHSANVRSQSPVILPASPKTTVNTGGWIMVGVEDEVQPVVGRTLPPSQYSLALEHNLGPHDPMGHIKCCESLAFLVRDVAHITPYNFDDCVHCIRTFVEASLHGSKRSRKLVSRELKRRKPASGRKRVEHRARRSPVPSPEEEDDSDEEVLPSGYHQISIQLLDLMHTLHTRTAQIFQWWAEEGGEISNETSLWTHGWCPLLQGIARLCCDVRRQVRMSAITYLQRALLVHDLQTLTGPEWEACFQRVLFPLLNYLLQPIGSKDPVAMEETRMRAATLLSKVFLHHLTPLLSLPTFFNLWMTILDFMDRYMHADKSDLLYEAIPESLKNMLLVMDSANVFDEDDGHGKLWNMTWERIGQFLPQLKEELFKEQHAAQEEVVEQAVGEVTVTEPAKTVMQHNIENATRSSIIFQPLASHQTVSSPLFAHLGQMVSTPIGPSTQPDPSDPQQHSPTTNLPPPPTQPLHYQPPSQQTNCPFNPYSQSSILTTSPPIQQYQNNQSPHTFPILYNSPLILTSSPTGVQPISLYTEYVENPYTEKTRIVEESKVGGVEEGVETLKEVQADNVRVPLTVDADLLRSQYESQKQSLQSEGCEAVFQSSNYFGELGGNVPPGSEVLFNICASQSVGVAGVFSEKSEN